MNTRKSRKKPKVPFPHKLILNQWILSLFNVRDFDQLASVLKINMKEGLNERGSHHFHTTLAEHCTTSKQLPESLLLECDQNIVKHTKRLNEKRLTRYEPPIVWKYFQYLGLLFCEIYLDRYFRDPESLLHELNEHIYFYNRGKPNPEKIEKFDESKKASTQLNKLAFWMATGSGKTLLMHINLLQYLSSLSKHGRPRELNRILLLTPNEGLSHQHLHEFHSSGIVAHLFDKNRCGLFHDETVEILEVTKLRDEMGDKTVSVDAFEGNNLVLIDEGHRGASAGKGGVWMGYRNALCENGFSFEYSATFGQAIKGNPYLTHLYAKSILYDYSYRYFYSDGYGKDYQILNLDNIKEKSHLDTYMVACLLSFFQQQRLYRNKEKSFRPFNIENPLWIFVGGRVTATLGQKDASDIIEILRFLDRYVTDISGSIQRIERVLHQGLVNYQGKNIFAERFTYLDTLNLSSSQIYDETIKTIFNSTSRGRLCIENIKRAPGEIALKLGSRGEPFGVINVGDDVKLVKICDEKGLHTEESMFSRSIFHSLNQSNSKINILIGSKKFTEGWNSWRVSTMGLMNVGKGEGAQIIQLFGRGVRLKGQNMSLKRSIQSDQSTNRPHHIGLLETLGIFGIHADYMAQFRDFLVEEGLPANENRVEFILPVINNLGRQKLKTIRLKKKINGISTESGNAFDQLGPAPTVAPPDPDNDPDTVYLYKNPVRLNWYPMIQAMKSKTEIGEDTDVVQEPIPFRPEQIAFFDYDSLYLELHRFKTERGWYNLNLSSSVIKELLSDQHWYRLLIPPSEMIGDSYDKVHMWEEIALALLKKYIERYYTFRMRQWELPHLEYSLLNDNDPNFLGISDSSEENGYYRIIIDQSKDAIVSELNKLKDAIEKGEAIEWKFQGIEAHWFGHHLFEPLLTVKSKFVEVSPAPLNKSELTFVNDLGNFLRRNTDFCEKREIYLLRNLSRGRGVGFFEAGNFYPDFILWLVSEGEQKILFIDPKGIRHLSKDNPKIQFFKTIKEIEDRLDDPLVSLHSFIISNTPSSEMSHMWAIPKRQMEDLNIFFQEEDKFTYINKMFSAVNLRLNE